MKKYTSKNTSVNSKKTPKGFNLLYPYGKVLDYGCGKYWQNNKKYVEERGAEYTGYDPYNKENNIVLDEHKGEFDTIYCTNVLNVIYDAYNIVEIIENISELLAINGIAIITIYEGDKTGIGKETKPDCWQRNEKTKDYKMFFDYAEMKYCLISFKSDHIKIRKLTRTEYNDIEGYIEKPF